LEAFAVIITDILTRSEEFDNLSKGSPKKIEEFSKPQSKEKSIDKAMEEKEVKINDFEDKVTPFGSKFK